PNLTTIDQLVTSLNIPDDTADNVTTLFVAQNETEATPLPLFTCTNDSNFLADLTIPDGTLIEPGTPFTKSWQIQNNGTCQWDTSYQLQPRANTDLFQPAPAPTIPETPPGAPLDLTVQLIAPTQSGQYQASWQLTDPTGEPIGVPLTILVNIAAPTPETPPTVPAPTYGRITGFINYPNGTYTDLEIFILNVNTGFYHQYTTTADWGSYWQEVDPGTYVIFGRVAGDSTQAVAYTNAVACGLTPNCTDHTLRQITVEAGDVFTGLNLADWQVNGATLPWP
ncbi:MAG TPA: NBR1-Ig-like domain-containing protein, partial [Anaerolineae bacterium]|nr:NBR1-Ig-like domain-containing protein [Anaerolineae bacterium]